MVLCVNLLINVIFFRNISLNFGADSYSYNSYFGSNLIFLRISPQKNVEINVKMKINSLSGQFVFGKQKRQNP